MLPPQIIQHPRPGMLATIRNRRGIIATVEPFDSQEGRLHLVRVEYTDSDGVAEDTVLWEREHGRDLLGACRNEIRTVRHDIGRNGAQPPGFPVGGLKQPKETGIAARLSQSAGV